MRIERPLPADGQAARITELWAWTVIDPLIDVEGIVALKSPRQMPLVFSVESLARRAAPVAEEIARQVDGATVRLRRFVAVEDES